VLVKRFDFILVDDVPVNNLLARRIIEKTYPDALVRCFTEVDTVIGYLSGLVGTPESAAESILLLDIYMPGLNGWDFLQLFEQFESGSFPNMKIWMLSSSISNADKERAEAIPLVAGYILKPFSADKIREIVVASLSR
jgi:CheY-like chemotaxis protein